MPLKPRAWQLIIEFSLMFMGIHRLMICVIWLLVYILLIIPLNQTWTYCSTILLGPISWPFFSINPKSFIGIGIVWSFTFWSFNFVTVLLLLVFKTLNIGLYKVYFWYCIGIVLLYGNIYLGNSVSGKNLEHLKTKQF